MAIESMTSTASDIQMDYMKLLVVQLQNQNPLEPLDNNEMASQLAQFSQLSQLETMNSSFSEALVAAERTYANSLIGKEVSFAAETSDGTSDITSGIVEQVINDYEGQIALISGDYVISLEDVISVKN
jgi:flagellar basal-body rod modification protein FlgD